MHIQSRRHFLKNAAILSPVLTFFPSYLTAGKGSKFRIAFIGTGMWGQQYLKQALQHKDLDVRAISETNSAAISQSLDLFNQAGRQHPDIYRDNYETLLSRQDIDAVIIAAPWHQHYSIAKAAMLAGKHVACGSVMGTTLEEHQDIVRISEQTRCQYFTLDEHSYRSDLMAITNMAQEGVFGELQSVHAGASPHVLPVEQDKEALSYPVYSAAAVARLLNLKENTYVSLQVVQLKQQYAISKPCPKKGHTRLFFTSGDVSSICLTTQQGQKVWLQMDAGKTQPVSTGFHVNGSNGSWVDLFNRIYLEENNPVNQVWEPGKPYINQYAQQADLPRYRQVEKGDGYAMALQEFVGVMQQRNELSVYAAATNSIITPMAVLSAQRNGATVQFPQFRNPII
ncbi:Gfo/Idh/MocA family protein [Chitinophaga filiformis]|uniref:Oxidoreductase family, NAD-binding Rossmann fold n=1 Tax=Chitinophaga filiformis TaxID=104663 RepID=A0A1G8D0R8_CHIFI|nr:Gfo/Idh/MocA family oxidoreductase [Chitinophaga filiformis]SDH51447.1 Oxidoreductase family, NAD-binding Rossmann fold [Chitinophaga filiformis]